jgi:DNA polymerase-3 subunit chi
LRVDFYQLSSDPAEAVVALLARNTLKAGKRLLVVAGDEQRLKLIGDTLWARKDEFLANGIAGGGDDARQPILLSQAVDARNGATFLVLADGLWRQSEGFERVFLVFDEQTVEGARVAWRELDAVDGVERHFWQQQGARWSEQRAQNSNPGA